MAIDKDTAVEIINEYNSGGFEDHIELPEDEEELIEKATELYEEAKKAFASGMRDNAIQGMIFLGDTASLEGPHFDSADERDAYFAEQEQKKKDEAVLKTLPRRSSGGISEQDEREGEDAPFPGAIGPIEHEPNSLVLKENLPIPQHIEGDPEPMPRDLSSDSITDKKIRKLSSEYNAYLTRVTYLLGLASSDLANAEHLLEAERAKVWNALDKKNKLVKVIEAEILADEGVSKLSADVNRHQQMVIVLKSLKEIYGGNVDRLSREWTMRQNEWEKSRK